MQKVQVTIIIPTLNEEKYLGDCLKSLPMDSCEIIVVDGNSKDDTVAIASKFGAKVICMGIANRAQQMNAGAKAARGDILLFFHADSRLPMGGMGEVIKVMKNPHIMGGGFALGFYPSDPFYAFLAISANIFCRITRMIFGDRGIFIRTNDFQQIGGYAELAIMEDAVLATKMRQMGKIAILPGIVMTSARKYETETKFQAVYRTVWAYSAYRLGVPAEKIKAGYYVLGRK